MKALLKLQIHWQILIALLVAILFGIFFPQYVSYVSWMGDLFLRALKMIIIPLIVSSMIMGVANIGNAESLGRIGLKTIAFYLITSLIAILTGLLLVNFIKPGIGIDIGFTQTVNQETFGNQSLGNILLRIIPDNIFDAMAKADILSIIFFSLLFGYFITKLEEKHSQPLKKFFDALFEIMMKITMFVIKFTPLGIFGIVAGVIAKQAGDSASLLSIFERMSVYMLCVLGGIFFHTFITMSLVLKLGKINPVKHLKNMSTVMLTAFSTSSSNATLPVTMDAVENKCGVSNKISSFTLPLGATVNMNGTALYECVAVIFIAQVYGIDLSIYQQFVIVMTSLLAAIGSAGIPMAGLVMMTVILNAVGLPLEGIGLILTVDRILDMFRTSLNVYGDTCGAVVIAKSEGEVLNV
jgi:Na+/H+-dicarboxylate symporter